uniref:Eukaryotic translation initiation factor 3 subunit K n=1 Tax=Acrobeloides nanus TaxID=290746 RepID=A0A914BZV0_9BILA
MADKSKSFEELREDLYRSIKGVNRYNPENIPNLEKAIRMMIDDHNCYDKDILLTTLKLYQLNVEKFNEAVVAQILLKAMMVFPRNDFALAKYLIDGKFLMEGSKSYSPDLRRIMDIGAILEACNFGLFWKLMRNEYQPSDSPSEKFSNPADVQKTIKQVAGFEDAVRRFACQVINVTFQSIEKPLLLRLLGGISEQQLAPFAKYFGWKPQPDGTYFVQNHEDTIKSRNIEEKLKFDQCAVVVRSGIPGYFGEFP